MGKNNLAILLGLTPYTPTLGYHCLPRFSRLPPDACSWRRAVCPPQPFRENKPGLNTSLDHLRKILPVAVKTFTCDHCPCIVVRIIAIQQVQSVHNRTMVVWAKQTINNA